MWCLHVLVRHLLKFSNLFNETVADIVICSAACSISTPLIHISNKAFFSMGEIIQNIAFLILICTVPMKKVKRKMSSILYDTSSKQTKRDNVSRFRAPPKFHFIVTLLYYFSRIWIGCGQLDCGI